MSRAITLRRRKPDGGVLERSIVERRIAGLFPLGLRPGLLGLRSD